MTPPSVEEVKRILGPDPLISDWIDVQHTDMTGFARVTHDEDWIHTDPVRARAAGFDGTIAFGFWTLSLLTQFLRDALEAEYPADADLGLNYGLDRVRFLAPVPVGGRVRGHITVTEVREKKPGRLLVSIHCEVEIEDHESLAMVADWLILLVYHE